jgi:hypothetical protein
MPAMVARGIAAAPPARPIRSLNYTILEFITVIPLGSFGQNRKLTSRLDAAMCCTHASWLNANNELGDQTVV